MFNEQAVIEAKMAAYRVKMGIFAENVVIIVLKLYCLCDLFVLGIPVCLFGG